ncbi:MAG: hypothetical protein A2104_00075 [Candidatus Melainabacteria bacterium GWF2_32_7]|nr:MAG: hypothetical protein A2104_00075 [Candidatus Melainabacteria bacterium GWF2_32_7]
MKQIISKLKQNFKILATSFGVLILIVSFFVFQNEKPTSLNGMLKQGEKYTKEGKLSLALEHYIRTAKSFPWSYEAHMHLGNTLLQVKEPQKAKIEYYRAIKLNYSKKHDAYFTLANIYVSENNFKFAQEILNPIKDVPNKKALEQIGDFYYSWGQKLISDNDFETIRKYREAYEFYKKADSKKVTRARKTIEKAYSQIADKLVADKKISEAINILNLSIEFSNNALAHYKLAKIYETRNEELALSEYEKVYKKLRASRRFDSSGYVNLLTKKADMYKARGDAAQTQYYYHLANKVSLTTQIPYITDKHIILTLISARYNENIDRDTVIPGISFKIMNVSKAKVHYLKAKVVFSDNEKIWSEEVIRIAEPGSPMLPDAITETINTYSTTPMLHVFADHDIKVQIYLSQSEPDNWKLYRNFYFEGQVGSTIVTED